MTIKKFILNQDLEKLESYLRNQYLENKNMTSWLPERLHDLIYRMDTQYTDAGNPKSSDYIFIWEDNEEIVGCILPDGDAIYISIKKGKPCFYTELILPSRLSAQDAAPSTMPISTRKPKTTHASKNSSNS